ncbi:hypothetical protein HMPREF9104_00819, partial [Lentilactobacillus kisonensis F0435]
PRQNAASALSNSMDLSIATTQVATMLTSSQSHLGRTLSFQTHVPN